MEPENRPFPEEYRPSLVELTLEKILKPYGVFLGEPVVDRYVSLRGNSVTVTSKNEGILCSRPFEYMGKKEISTDQKKVLGKWSYSRGVDFMAHSSVDYWKVQLSRMSFIRCLNNPNVYREHINLENSLFSIGLLFDLDESHSIFGISEISPATLADMVNDSMNTRILEHEMMDCVYPDGTRLTENLSGKRGTPLSSEDLLKGFFPGHEDSLKEVLIKHGVDFSRKNLTKIFVPYFLKTLLGG